MPDVDSRLSYIQEKLGSKVLDALSAQGDDLLLLTRDGLRDSFLLLKRDGRLEFDFLSDITAVDYWKKKSRASRLSINWSRASTGAGCASVCRYRKTIQPWSR